jgi:uncharacterized protein (DUF433 family)
MAKEYVETRDGGYFIKGSRVSLDSAVYAFLRGESPEGIAESFPALGLEQIFGGLAFYLANREIVVICPRGEASLRPCVSRRGKTVRHCTRSLTKHEN